ncbi:hypothetical protein P2P98_03055 [Microbacterium sp. Kw_RZR3]|uniref:hypothetical protein n=1 Tax=Microbacterium sp. Kw_RZR3 TaxID=3032903 RepID=UPI0023DCC66C|nr:hypothetical protein [Microbacterium sp. Kw_RZR3]MDF2045127.1 hypothetical protein [Microbacterium sp. Kw_RZR3]
MRRLPLILAIAFGLLTLMCGWIVWGVLAQAGTTPSMQGPMPYVIAVMFGILGLFAVIVFLNLIAASRSRASWGNRQCIAVGRSGIAVRYQGVAVNIPWDEVTGIWATTTNSTGVSQAGLIKTPVLRIERDTGDGTEGVLGSWNIAPFVLDAAPQATYAAVHFSRLTPAARHELGTTLGQQRIDGFAGYAPTTVAPRG